MNPNSVFHLAGLLVCGATVAWFGLSMMQGFQQMLVARRRFQLDQRLIEQDIAAATTIAKTRRLSGWDGLRRFRVKWKVRESKDCHSLYLVPHDGKPLPDFLPGQYITLSVKLPNETNPTVRCYSLSDRPRNDYYRLTIQKLVHPDGSTGKVSGHLNDAIKEGDIFSVRTPTGSFCLDPMHDQPVVLLAGGIGITPIMSMLLAIAEAEIQRDVFLFYGVRNGNEHSFRESLRTISQESPHINVITCYSRPDATDHVNKDYDVAGRVTIDLLKERLPSSNYHFYLCGPEAFTTTLVDDLVAWNVPESTIHFEAFGPATPKRGRKLEVASGTSVEFEQSGCKTNWADDCATLLDLAEKNGVSIDSGCRTGSCGTCATAIKRGKVKNTELPNAAIDEGTCLPCIAVPNGPLVLDA